MGPITTNVLTSLGSAFFDIAKGKLGEQIIEGVTHSLNPDEITKSASNAIDQANRSYPQFLLSCEAQGLRGSTQFLLNFFGGRGISELQKPLVQEGVPDHIFLSEAFLIDARSHSELKKINHEFLTPWMKAFSDAYFRDTNQSIRFAQLRDTYYQQIQYKFSNLSFAGIPIQNNINKLEGIHNIFVMPDLQPNSVIEKFPSSAENKIPSRKKNISTIQALLHALHGDKRKSFTEQQTKASRQQRIVLLGESGSGKTMLLSYLISIETSRDISGENRDNKKHHFIELTHHQHYTRLLPIFIRAQDFSDNLSLSVVEFVKHYAANELALTEKLDNFFEYFLSRGEALILVDGLDEITNSTKRHKASEKIRVFLNYFNLCPCVITSRPSGYKEELFYSREFSYYDLLPFDESRINAFVNRWFDRGSESLTEGKDKFRIKLEKLPYLTTLSSNPLLLTITALVYSITGEVVTMRSRLYKIIIETLLEEWDRERKGLDFPATIPDYYLAPFIENIAYWIHNREESSLSQERVLISQDDLLREAERNIQEFGGLSRYQAKKEAKILLNYILHRSSGLIGSHIKGSYSFIHRSFQADCLTQIL